MSSILRAMKKAEQTAAAGRFSGPRADRGPVPGAEAPRRPKLSPRRTAAAAALLALAAALGGGIYFSRPAQTPETTPAVDILQPAARPPVAGGQRPELPREAAPPPAAPLEGAGPALSPQSPAAPARRAAGGPQGPASESRPTVLPQPEATPSLGDHAAPPAAAEGAPGPPSAPGKRPALTLEGIVWSDDPKGRMAVINGKMVREGDFILGVRIQTIGENDVAVAADGDRWMVRF
jgi:general secretion pathway protein B